MTDMQIRARGVAEGPVILALVGEVDLANAEEVAATLRAYVASTTGDVRLDCSGLEFIDSSGLTCLVNCRQELEGTDRRFVLCRMRPSVRRVFEIVGLDQEFVLE